MLIPAKYRPRPFTWTRDPEYLAHLEQGSQQDGEARGIFMDTSGNARVEIINPSARYEYLWRTDETGAAREVERHGTHVMLKGGYAFEVTSQYREWLNQWVRVFRIMPEILEALEERLRGKPRHDGHCPAARGARHHCTCKTGKLRRLLAEANGCLCDCGREMPAAENCCSLCKMSSVDETVKAELDKKNKATSEFIDNL